MERKRAMKGLVCLGILSGLILLLVKTGVAQNVYVPNQGQPPTTSPPSTTTPDQSSQSFVDQNGNLKMVPSASDKNAKKPTGVIAPGAVPPATAATPSATKPPSTPTIPGMQQIQKLQNQMQPGQMPSSGAPTNQVTPQGMSPNQPSPQGSPPTQTPQQGAALPPPVPLQTTVPPNQLPQGAASGQAPSNSPPSNAAPASDETNDTETP